MPRAILIRTFSAAPAGLILVTARNPQLKLRAIVKRSCGTEARHPIGISGRLWPACRRGLFV
jgi:hypothetical protein